MIKNIMKIICILVSMLLLISIAMPATAEIVETTEIFQKDADGLAKAKPDNPPGKPDKPPKPDDPPDPDPPVDKWAVIVGIADYQGIGSDLMYPDDDAVDMYNYLLAKGYPKDNIKLLLNNKARAKNIYAAIDWMAGREGPDSECVFFYTGHGSTYDGYDDGDTEYTDEGIVSQDLYLILDGSLKTAFAGYESSKLTFIFDSCFSGGMDDLAGPDRVVVTACDEDQYSYDGTPAMSNGVFTYYFMEGLYAYNTIEGAYTYSAPLAHDYIYSNYDGAIMDPQIFDQYDADWEF
jgi:hypothetical protein